MAQYYSLYSCLLSTIVASYKPLIIILVRFPNCAHKTVDLDNEEILSEEERGLVPTAVKDQITECLGFVRNMFLTKITSK